MNDYFNEISDNLTFNDLSILTVLYDKEAEAVFKAIDYSFIINETNLTSFQFKKAIYRLEALKFIEVYSRGKQNKVFITDYGYLALNKNFEGVEVE